MTVNGSREAVIQGRRHRWLRRGEGTPVVLLHGIPTSPALWRRVLPLLEGVQADAWEMQGYGASMDADPDLDISLAAQADYLAQWMDDQGIPAAVLVGHDLGGGVAQILAARHPERCLGLVLTNSVCYDSWPIPSVRFMRATAPVVERYPRPALRAVLSSFIHRGHDDPDVARASKDVHLRPYMQPDGSKAFARQVRSLRTQDTLDVEPLLPSLRVPARIVWGAADGFQRIEYGRRLAQDLGAELVEIPDGRHFTPEDHPEQVATAILAVARQAVEQRVRTR